MHQFVQQPRLLISRSALLHNISVMRTRLRAGVKVCAMIEEVEMDLGLWDEKRDCSSITGPADTQIWGQSGQASETMYQTFVKAGIPWVQADKKSRQTNAQHLARRLADHDNGTKQPGVVFFSTCKKLIETLPAVQSEPGDPDTPMDGGEDHWTDSAWYASAFASRGRKMIPKRKEAPDEWEQEVKKSSARKGTSFGYGARA